MLLLAALFACAAQRCCRWITASPQHALREIKAVGKPRHLREPWVWLLPQTYTDNVANVRVAGGNLYITALQASHDSGCACVDGLPRAAGGAFL